MLEFLFWTCVFIVFYTYIGYGIILYGLVKLKELFHKPKTISQEPDEELPDVTLLVAAYNEEEVVRAKMNNSQALDYPADKLKFIWVTDGSTDRTCELLSEYEQVQVLHQPLRSGKTAALNRAMMHVNTPIVVFTDANTLINKEAIREIVKCFSDPTVGCVAGEKRVTGENTTGSAGRGEGLYWKYESTLKELDSRLYSAMGAAGELYAIRKELFEKMPDNTLLDDFILSMRIVSRGYKIAYQPHAFACENGSANMHEEEKRKIRISAGGLQSIARLYPLLNPFRYGIVTFQYISHRVLRWSVTPIALFALPILNVAVLCTNAAPPPMLYLLTIICQVLLFLMGIAGSLQERRGKRSKLLYIPYYFLFMNINVLKGYAYLYKRRKGQNGAWEKSRRA